MPGRPVYMKQKLAGQPGVKLVTVWQTVSLATLELISKSWEPSAGGMEAPAGQNSMSAAVPLLQLPSYPFQPGTVPFGKKDPATTGVSNPPLTTRLLVQGRQLVFATKLTKTEVPGARTGSWGIQPPLKKSKLSKPLPFQMLTLVPQMGGQLDRLVQVAAPRPTPPTSRNSPFVFGRQGSGQVGMHPIQVMVYGPSGFCSTKP